MILEKAKAVERISSKGQSKGPSNFQPKQKLDPNACAYCGKFGHWQKDCHKKKADQQQQKQVRVVGESPDVTSLRPPIPSASTSTGSGSQAIRVLSLHGGNSHVGHVKDLTIYSVATSPCTSPHAVRVLILSVSSMTCL